MAKDSARKMVALIAAYNAEGKLLLGKRNDNSKWTLPGGHIEDGEDPTRGAVRELFEETGLRPTELELKNVQKNPGRGPIVYFYRAVVEGEPTGKNDPDQECDHWEFVDAKDGLPYEIYDNLHGPEHADSNVVKQTYDLHKAEDDEVEKLIKNPDWRERVLALKLGSVRQKHLVQALLDPEFLVAAAAMKHPLTASDPHVLTSVIAAKTLTNGRPIRNRLVSLLQHDTAHDKVMTPSHLRQIYELHQEHPGMLHGIASHPAATDTDLAPWSEVKRKPEGGFDLACDDGLEKMAIADIPQGSVAHGLADYNHILTPEHKSAGYELHLIPGNKQYVAQVRHNGLLVGYADADLNSAQKTISPGSESQTFVKEPHRGRGLGNAMYEALYAHAYHNGIRTVSGSTHTLDASRVHRSLAKKHGLDYVSHYTEPKTRGPYQYTLKSEGLAKAVKPSSFSAVAKATDPTSKDLVDYSGHMGSHPQSHGALAEAYNTGVVTNPDFKNPIARKGKIIKGITKKVLFRAQVPGEEHPSLFMVKPYHEKIPRVVNNWKGLYPIGGWAEMAHQALYHAAGIGHLHQRVHMVEHDMGPGHEKEPALVVYMEPGFQPVQHAPYHSWKKEQTKVDIRKMAIMDFLTNNVDRHGGNLMMREDGHLLAIDHGLSMQYVTNPYYVSRHQRIWQLAQREGDLADSFGLYHNGSALDIVDSLRPGAVFNEAARDRAAIEGYKPAFDWWGKVSGPVREEMQKQIGHIKDLNLRAHIKRNFEARAAWLDERSKFGIENYGSRDWYRDDSVRQYRPGELTEEEMEGLKDRRRILMEDRLRSMGRK